MAISTTVESLLRLAWKAEQSGRPNLRDALLTLAVAESGPEEAVLAERCRRLLIARQPDHWYATTVTLGQALAHPKVAPVIDRLRVMFPPVRVQRALFRSAVEEGAFDGSAEPLRKVFEGLGLIPAGLGRGLRGRHGARTLRFPSVADDPRDLGAFYLSLLFSMAVLLQAVTESESDDADRDARAA